MLRAAFLYSFHRASASEEPFSIRRPFRDASKMALHQLSTGLRSAFERTMGVAPNWRIRALFLLQRSGWAGNAHTTSKGTYPFHRETRRGGHQNTWPGSAPRRTGFDIGTVNAGLAAIPGLSST